MSEELERCNGCDEERPGIRTYRIHIHNVGWMSARYCRTCADYAADDFNGETVALASAPNPNDR